MPLHVRLLVFVFLLTATACGSSSTPTYGGGGGGGGGCTSTSNSITIADFSFSPSCTTVALSTQVTWTNTGAVSHTTTSDVPGQWDSGVITATNTYSHTFNSAGTFAYHCSIHPQMTATIVVTP